MPIFSYSARDASGVLRKGTVEAATESAARSALTAQDLQVEEIRSSSVVAGTRAKNGSTVPEEYYPLTDTLRLYAGWLIAWYFIIYALGSYQFLRSLPFQLSFLEDLFFSPLILAFAWASFLFLLLSSIHRLLGRKLLIGLLLTIIGVGMFLLFQANT